VTSYSFCDYFNAFFTDAFTALTHTSYIQFIDFFHSQFFTDEYEDGP